MINGDVKVFVENNHYEDCTALYNGREYFFNGCCYHLNENGEKVYTFEVFPLDDEASDETLFWIQAPTAEECIEKFLAAKIFDGKTFYEVEEEMTQTG